MQLDSVDGVITPPLALRVVHGAGPDQAVLIVDDELRIGRDAEGGVMLVLPDPSVSRLHASIERDGGRLMLADRGSSNGVFLNAIRVDRAELHAGDVVRLGDSILVVDRAPMEGSQGDLGLIGTSAAICDLRETVRRVGGSTLPVLITGPTGAGKELVALALHAVSGRTGRFVAVNCAALPAALAESVLFGHRKGAFTGAQGDHDGAFVQAHGGTLFLDEIGEMPLEEQPKLLRALETREVVPLGGARAVPVDLRVVVATNVEMPAALEAKRFRADLYSRLAGIVIHTPPLTERREDVLLLFRHFLGDAVAPRPITADFAESLCTYSWPLNVREVRSLAERLVLLFPDALRWERGMLEDPIRVRPSGSELASPPAPAETSPAASHAGGAPSDSASPVDTLPERSRDTRPATREELIALLDSCGGNVTLAARRAGRSRKQVYRWMREFGLTHGTGRGGA